MQTPPKLKAKFKRPRESLTKLSQVGDETLEVYLKFNSWLARFWLLLLLFEVFFQDEVRSLKCLNLLNTETSKQPN